MTLNKPILLLGCVLFFLQTLAQQNNIRFKRITINEGLSLSSVYCIFRDSKGFMWFGTEDGLNRYDGKNFKIYRSTPENENTISHKWIEQIHEDSNGKLWFGSRGGLTQYDPVKEKFTQFRGIGNSKKLVNDTITTIFECENRKLWIGTLKGINCIDLENLQMLEFNNSKRIQDRVNCFHQLVNGNILIGSQSGLYHFNSANNKFKKIKFSDNVLSVQCITKFRDNFLIGSNNGVYTLDSELKILEQALEDTNIENILIDSLATIWISTDNALLRKGDKVLEYSKAVKSFEATNSLSINTNKPIIYSNSGDIWFGTYGSGVFRFDDKKHHYQNNSADPQSLSENSINCIYEDKNGLIWIGTFGAGISIYDPQAHKFNLIKNNPLSENSLPSNFIWSVWEDKQNNVWIGTNNKGLSKYNITRDSFVHYDFRKKTKRNHTAIRKVFEDSKQNIWIGTDGDGLIKFKPKTGKRKYYTNIANNSNSLSSNSVRVIFEDSEGLLWVGTQNGLNLFNSKTETFTQFKHSDTDRNSISSNFVYSLIFEDSKGLIWVGTYGGGLNSYNKSTKEFTNYQFSINKDNGISDNVAFSMIEEKDGIFWIGTNNKLNRFDSNTGNFEHFGTEQGLPNNVIYGILKDENNSLWLSTNKGICKFSLKDYSCDNFDIHDGLQSNEFNGGAFHKGKSGIFYFGGVYGLNYINPNKKYKQDVQHEVALTKLEIHGQPVEVSSELSNTNKIFYSEENDSYSFSKSIAYTDSIELDYEHRFVSFEFSTLSNLSPDKINYAYRLKGLEKKWVYSNKRNFASYSNLSPGTYTFQVIVQYPNGKWSEQPKDVIVLIHPPFYLTWWFILFEIIIGLLFLAFVYRFLLHRKTNKLLSAQNEQIKIANQNLKESEKNLRELVDTKNKFFRIISHDLKNPFTSLLSISEMIHENYEMVDDDEKQTGIRKIHESVKHIFTLLENLLTWSRSQTGKIQFIPEVFNLSDLISESVNLYKTSADKKQIKLVNECCEELSVIADRNMCSSVLRNLLNNALKFSYAESQITIRVNPKENFHEIQVIDQGIGIEKENIEKLFRVDLKFKSTGTSGEKGTGLGLLLCKEFVEINGGQIKVESEINKGSVFSFTLSNS